MQARRVISVWCIALFCALLTTPVLAQYTTSSIGGTVTDDAGNPIANATVVVVHGPTGTRKEVVSQAGGRYRAPGLRVGGPYTVTVTKDGYQGDRYEEVYINLQEVFALNVQMVEAAAELSDLEIVGNVSSGLFNPDYKGTQTTVSREQIESFPTINRSVNDFARFDPRVVVQDKERQELSIAGQNNRYNNLTVDNVPSNDEFGLNASGQPARNQVVSIETIEQLQINISPYDASQSSFTGGGINAVTKSGSNEFSGSAFYMFRDDSFIGDDENGNEFNFFDEDIYGLTFGGPIIKDKLFFYASWEHFERSDLGPNACLQGEGCSNEFDTPASDIQRIIDISQGVYGFDAGGANAPGELMSEDDNYMVKLDWNINQDHRATFQFTRNDGFNSIVPNRNRTNFSLSSHWYDNAIERDAYSAQLYSAWSPNFSTEANFSLSEYHSEPDTNAFLPEVRIDTDGGSVWLGRESFRHANMLDSDVFTAYFAGEYLTGDHNIRFGIDYKENDFNNVFVFNSLGEYRFDSIDDYENNVVERYQYRIGTDPNDPFPAADWSYNTTGLFLQDTWDVSYNLSIIVGARIDLLNVDDEPLYNALFEQTYGFSNQGTLDGNDVFQPRVGFNWDMGGDVAQQLRGGVGLFMGSSAGVWLSNPFTNPGGNVGVFSERDGEVLFNPDPFNQPRPGGEGSVGRQDVDVVDPDFEQPTVWKANLAYDRELPWGVNMTAEVQYSTVENGIQYEHLNLGASTGNLPDARPSFYCDPRNNRSGSRCNADDNFNDVLLLTNTDKGSTLNWTAEFSKIFNENWSARVAYTTGRSSAVNPGTSSRAISNWNNRATYNPNEDVESTSNYETRERIIGSLEFRQDFFEGLSTSVAVFYEARTGRPFSYTFDNDANGDNIRDNDLLYVPSGPGNVVFSDPAEEAEFLEIVESTPCLRRFKGTVVSRGHCSSPTVNSLDLRISQEIPAFGFGKGQIFLNILNFGNLLDSDWGHVDEVPFEYVAEIVDFDGVTSDGRYIYDLTRRQDQLTRRRDRTGESRWSMQLGLRFDF